MSGLFRRASIVMALAAAAGGLLGVAPASAQPVAAGTLAFSGDAGDYISGGGSYSYDTASNDSITVSGDASNSVVSVSVNGAAGDWWTLDLAAPKGQPLAVGSYTGATRYPFQAPTVPGLDLSGNGRGCNTLTGSFEVQAVSFGPAGYVEKLDATYEQHCEGWTAALRGEVHISNPPPPPVLDLGLAVSTDGTASTLNGKAYISGTVNCTTPAEVTVSGLVTQVANRVLIRGNYSTRVDCTPGAPVAWSAAADPTGTTPYQRGKVEVLTDASGVDPTYGNTVRTSAVTVVTLRRG